MTVVKKGLNGLAEFFKNIENIEKEYNCVYEYCGIYGEKPECRNCGVECERAGYFTHGNKLEEDDLPPSY